MDWGTTGGARCQRRRGYPLDGFELMAGFAAVGVSGHSTVNPTRIDPSPKLPPLSAGGTRAALYRRQSMLMNTSPAGTLGKK